MPVTSQQVAEAAGVSRGTVYRALNNRGRINSEVADRIRRIAEEMGYQPSRAGKALVMSKRAMVIGVIVQAAGTPFMEKVLEGIEDARTEIEGLGAEVRIYKINNLDLEKAIEAMQELKQQGCDGIAMVPTEDERLKEMVNQFAEENIPVITFNLDMEGSKRLCFVGQDTFQSGKAAAGLMAEILPENGRVLVISGYPSSYGHRNRTDGFRQELTALRKDVCVLDVQYAFDDDHMAEMIARGMVREYPDLAGIYLAAAGVQGVCRVLEELHLAEQIKVISNDLTEQNLQYLERGLIRFLLGQDGYRQGYEPIMLLFDKLFDGKDPERERIYTEIVIKTRYNIKSSDEWK